MFWGQKGRVGIINFENKEHIDITLSNINSLEISERETEGNWQEAVASWEIKKKNRLRGPFNNIVLERRKRKYAQEEECVNNQWLNGLFMFDIEENGIVKISWRER